MIKEKICIGTSMVGFAVFVASLALLNMPLFVASFVLMLGGVSMLA